MLITDEIDGLRSALIGRIRRYAAEHGLAKAALAKRAGLSINTLAGMDRADWTPAPETLRALDKLINVRKVEQPAAEAPQPQGADAA